MNATRPTTPADHITQAKDALTGGADPSYATAHALIAIAELLAANQAEAYVLQDPDSPAVVEALTRRCDQCRAEPGQLCTRRAGITDDLKGRLIHIGRKEKP